ncbi:MAG TPA: DUF1772 domain-containing protein [Pseudonocardiaceae bacterium]
MHAGVIVSLISALFAGLLAGEEFVVRYGVRGPITTLDDDAHIRVRQALIRTLRILVPSIFLPTLVSAVTATAVHGIDGSFAVRCVAVGALLVWFAVTLGGTAPINKAAMSWAPGAPPVTWRAQVRRWERLDTIRAWAAVVAFALLLTALPSS